MRQGEIWLVNLDPTLGAGIRKTRPCVILNDDAIEVWRDVLIYLSIGKRLSGQA